MTFCLATLCDLLLSNHDKLTKMVIADIAVVKMLDIPSHFSQEL